MPTNPNSTNAATTSTTNRSVKLEYCNKTLPYKQYIQNYWQEIYDSDSKKYDKRKTEQV